jgi:hypothetical protein
MNLSDIFGDSNDDNNLLLLVLIGIAVLFIFSSKGSGIPFCSPYSSYPCSTCKYRRQCCRHRHKHRHKHHHRHLGEEDNSFEELGNENYERCSDNCSSQNDFFGRYGTGSSNNLIFIILIAICYYIILFKHSYLMSNIMNLSIDGILLGIYFYKFCTEVRVDSDGVNLYTLFKKYRIANKDIEYLRQAAFLTQIASERKTFYILTSVNGRYILQDMFKIKNK